MAFNFATASSQYLQTFAAPAQGTPITLAAWLYMGTAGTTARTIVSIGDGQGSSRSHSIRLNATNACIAVSSGATTTGTAAGAGNAAANSWTHICGVFDSNTSRTVWRNGSAGTLNTTDTGTLPNFLSLRVGASHAIPVSVFADNIIAEVGVWNASLTAGEILALSRGVACKNVRPQSLQFYAPLIRDLVDLRGGLTITNNGAATVADHPRIYL